jgi:hypothetical protein
LREKNPAARLLPLLAALDQNASRNAPAQIVLSGANGALQVSVTPVRA